MQLIFIVLIFSCSYILCCLTEWKVRSGAGVMQMAEGDDVQPAYSNRGRIECWWPAATRALLSVPQVAWYAEVMRQLI